MIQLEGVSKQYLYGARVLFGVDLTVGDGEILAVLGDEQSGKTTLLKVIAGVTECEGKVLVDGAPIAKKARRRDYDSSTTLRFLKTALATITLPIR